MRPQTSTGRDRSAICATVSARSRTLTASASSLRYRSLHQEFSVYLTLEPQRVLLSALTVCPRVRGRPPCTTSSPTSLHADYAAESLRYHSATTRTHACERERGNDPESSEACRRASNAAAHIGQQLHASGRAWAPRLLPVAWRREVSKRPLARCMTRTRRSSTHHPHTTRASIGRQRRDRSSNTRAEHTPLVVDRNEGRIGPRFA